jgi:hypothetical protein
MISEAVVPGKADTVSLQEVPRLGEKMYQEGRLFGRKFIPWQEWSPHGSQWNDASGLS